MSDFADFDEAVLEFFIDFGFIATYIKQNDSTYNTSTGENVITTVEIPVEAIMLDLTMQSNGLSTKFGTLIVAGDKEIYIRPPEKTDSLRIPLVINPASDIVRINNIDYTVLAAKEINPAATNVLLHNLHVRR